MAKWVSRDLEIMLPCKYVPRSRFSRSGAGETQLFPIGIMDSANSGFRPLTFFFRSIAFFDPLIFTVLQGGAREYEGK